MKAFRRSDRRVAVLMLFISIGLVTLAGHSTGATFAPPDAGARAGADFGDLPLLFEANLGQTDPRVKFLSRGGGYALYLTAGEAVLALKNGSRAIEGGRDFARPSTSVLRMKFIGADPSPVLQGVEEAATKSNYITGDEPEGWRSGVANYKRVRYSRLYRGVDLIFYGNQRQLEYDFIVAPGADFSRIGFALEGASSLRISDNGDLLINVDGGEIRHLNPVAYQEAGGVRRRVAARYTLDGNRVGFAVGSYDRSRPLVIDPILSYSTYLGGSDSDLGGAIAVDSAGNAYITGQTLSANFPTQGPLPGINPGASDAFVTKLNPSGTAAVYSTYIGGSEDERATGVALDSSGNVYVTGWTTSPNFPTVNPLQPALARESFTDAFALKLNAAGSALVYSTYIGGTHLDEGAAIAVDGSGNVCIAGHTFSSDFPTANAIQPALAAAGQRDAFVLKLNAAGSAFIYSTYLGGVGSDMALAVALDSAGGAHVTGQTLAANFPTVSPLQAASRVRSAFKTTNAGAGWNAINAGLPAHLEIGFLVIDPANPATLYAGVSGTGVFKSTNGGQSWALSSNGLTEPFIRHLAIDPVNTLRLYVAGGSVSRSTDGGASWSQAAGSGSLRHIAVDPSNSDRVLGSGFQRGISVSTNGGQTWQALRDEATFNASLFSVVFDPTNSNVVYAGTTVTAPFKSTDGGQSWAASDASILPFISSVIAIAPSNPSTLYAGGTNRFGIVKSTNGGASWTAMPTGQGAPTAAIVVDPSNPNIVYVATQGGRVMKSTDGGSTWSRLNSLPQVGVNAIVIDRLNPATLYAGGFPSSDAFVSKISPTGTALSFSTYLGGDDADSGRAIAVAASGGIFVAGTTASNNFPVVSPIQPNNAGMFDIFLSRLNPTGSALTVSTYLGGSATEAATGIALDRSGGPHLTGFTDSPNFPLLSPSQATLGGASDAFAMKLNASATSLVYSTYLGGSDIDEGNGIAVDPAGNAYVAGRTQSANFPTTPGAFQSIGAAGDGFVARISDAPNAVADLVLTQAAQGNTAQPGAKITYTLTLVNRGPDPAESIIVSDLLHPDLEFVSCSSTDGGSCEGSGNDSRVRFNALAPGATVRMTIVASVRCTVPDGTAINNTASVNAATGDSNPNNNVTSLLTTINNPAPTIVCPSGVTARTASPSDTSARVNYATPTASDNCADSVVECVPPSGSVFPVGSSSVTCTARDGAGASASCSFPVTVTNTAEAADLVVTQTVAPAAVESNANISYVVSLTNNGPELARNVVLISTLPAEVRFLFFDVTAGVLFTTEQSGNSLTVRFPAFGAGQVASVRVTGRVICTTADGSSLTGAASVSSSTADANTENNSASASARATNPPPLVICPGNIRVELTNGGPTDGRVVDYPLPNTFDNCEGTVVTCNPPPGSVFPVGTTTVDCLAADTGARIINCSFTVTVQSVAVDPVLMLIQGATVSGKKLFVFGINFPPGAVVLVNGEPQKTKNDSSNPSTTLKAKKGGKKIKRGTTVILQVVAPDGRVSALFSFMRPE